MVTLNQHYDININSDSIVFINSNEFIEKFIKWLEKSIAQLEQESKDLNDTQNLRTIDKNMIYLENERISHIEYKQYKLLEKMRIYRADSKEANKMKHVT